MKAIIKILIIILIAGLISCKKYLDEKPDKAIYTPTTLNDLQALLDNPVIYKNGPILLEIVADNYYVTTSTWENILASAPSHSQNYNWASNALPFNNSWIAVYQYPIYYANLVLDQLQSINIAAEEKDKYETIKGSALFYRAFAFYELTQLYCKPYSATTLNEPGIVLRITSDINAKSVRASIQQSYDQTIGDLKTAAQLLPIKSLFPTRPTITAAYGLLARIYLTMGDYKNAEIYASLCLQQKNDLLDYNNLFPLQLPRFKIFNEEVIYHNVAQSSPIISNTNAKVDSNLYRSYADADLRKVVYFRANTGVNTGTFSFIGSYNGEAGQGSIFDGITTAEIYLIRAECYARLGNKDLALADLNTLIKKRWNKNVAYPNIVATDANEAKNKILIERRKELPFRGQRWSDIRRLNLEGANISLKRIINNVEYTLPPNDSRSVALIPYDVINRSGIQQNPR